MVDNIPLETKIENAAKRYIKEDQWNDIKSGCPWYSVSSVKCSATGMDCTRKNCAIYFLIKQERK